MPDRTPEEREAARLERERRRAAREGRTPPPEPVVSDERHSEVAQRPESDAHQPTQQFDVTAHWTEEHATVVAPPAPEPAPEPEVPLGTKRITARERPRATGRRRKPPRVPGSTGRRLGGRALALLALGLIVLAGWFLNALYQPFAGEDGGLVQVQVPSGATVGEIGDLLAAKGVIDSAFFFELRAKLGGAGEDLKSGSFALREQMTYAAVLDALSESPAPPPVLRVTIPEGRSRGETAPIARQAGLEGDYVKASRSSKRLDPRRYGAPRDATLEGFLFPATYELPRDAEARDLVAAQLAAFKTNLATVDLRYAESKNLTVYDVLIIASMVEREVAVAKERPLVAAVIYNRLKAGMSLGIDATLRFGLSNWTEPLKVSELESDNPYNTRNRLGLPPGPIGNPGLASIEAAARPAKVDYLFYVVKPGTCGEHVFAATDAEHQRNVAAYEAAREAAGGKSPTTC